MAKRYRASFSISLLAVVAACTPASAQVAEGITFPIYYDAHELTKGQTNRLKMLISCKTAELQPNSTWRLGTMLLQHFDGYGRTNLIASSPDCTFNQAHKTVSSPAKLNVDADNGSLLLEGVGFFCTFTNTALTLSNNVETRIREDFTTQVRTNKTRPSLLNAGAGPGNTNRVSTNYITIFSDRMSFVLASNTVTYIDNVRVDTEQFAMTCQQLDGTRATNGALENIVAQQDVVLFNKTDGSSAYGDQAIYRVEDGRETVVLLGERARWQDALREALAKRFEFDLKEQRFRAEGNAYFKVPRMSIGQQSLLTGNSAASARTNAPQGDLEITAELVTAQLPTTNNPARSLTAVTNVVIVSAADNSHATGNEAKYSEATGTLELNGNAFWSTGERIISGDSLFADRSNRVFAVNGNAYLRLPGNELGKQSILSPFQSGRTNLTATEPQFIEMWCNNADYRGDTLTFREQIRGKFLEGTNALGAMTCGLLFFRFNSNQVESATAKHDVHFEQFPYTSTNGVTVSKSLDCELVNVLLATNGLIQRVIAETNVTALQLEQSKTNPVPVASSLRAQMVIGEFFAHTNRLRELVAIRDVTLAHETRKGHGERAVYSITNNTVELTGNPTADFPDGTFAGKITGAEALLYDLAQKKFVVIKPRAQGERVSSASTNQSNLRLPK
jgi:lipopolysaccharide export system protein LptA